MFTAALIIINICNITGGTHIMSNTSRVAIQETFDLPSRGKFPGTPEKITLRAMSLLDEKKRLSAQGISGLIDVIGDCVVNPENFDVYNLVRFDLDFLMIKLRIVSHGPLYNVQVTCPFCGKTTKLTINLDDIPIKYVDDDFTPTTEIGPLPMSGDMLKVKILTYADVEKIEAESKRILSKFPEYEGDPSDVLNYIYKIIEINGKTDIPYHQVKQYVERMSANDSIYFDEAYNDYLDEYGADTNIIFSCSQCKRDFTRYMPINDEFFRPKLYVK